MKNYLFFFYFRKSSQNYKSHEKQNINEEQGNEL